MILALFEIDTRAITEQQFSSKDKIISRIRASLDLQCYRKGTDNSLIFTLSPNLRINQFVKLTKREL